MNNPVVRYWVNWAENTDRPHHGHYPDMVALVDEKDGGEIAFFTNEDFAHDIAQKLNAFEDIVAVYASYEGRF